MAENPSVGISSMTNVSYDSTVLSFGYATKEEKKTFLRKNSDKLIYMDLTCFDPAEFYAEFPQLKGSFSALFCDEDKKIELHLRETRSNVPQMFIELGYRPVETTIISCGFIFPRTIVQIINEAHFALEEKIASREDIDRAMKFGVNYPKGPFEWAQGREIFVLTLLNELFIKTGDRRYIPSQLLSV